MPNSSSFRPTQPLAAGTQRRDAAAPGARSAAAARLTRVTHFFDDFDLPRFLEVARNFGSNDFGYVVTPNVDHMIRFHDNPEFRALYADARFILLDSRIAARAIRLTHGLDVPVCTGSDVTAALFDRVIEPNDRVVLVGGTLRQADALRARYGLEQLQHHAPPMGFIHDPQAVERCLQFVESAAPFRFCLLAVGSPRQEVIARMLAQRGHARGLALCIGASIDFLTGAERRAPAWIQRAHLEWLFRMLQNPRRLAGRYLVRGPRFFAHLRASRFVLRRSGAA